MKPFRALGLLVTFVAAAVLPALGSAAFGQPVVVVYPLTLAGAIASNEAGSDVAIILAQKVADGGGVTVRPPTPATERAHYLDAALAAKADYYVSGFLQTIGDDVSMILQVVSTHSGSVVFSTTTTIHTFGDAGLQADSLREAIIHHAGRGLAPLDAPPAVSAAPSSAPTNGPGLNLTRALRKRSKATPAPTETPTDSGALTPVSEIENPVASPSAKSMAAVQVRATLTPATLLTPTPTPTTAPSPASRRHRRSDAAAAATATPAAPPGRAYSTVLVVDAAGTESATLLAEASGTLLAALRNAGVRAARLPISGDDVRNNANTLCHANTGVVRFYVPTLLMSTDAGTQVARFSVDAIDCDGNTVATRTSSGDANARGGNTSAVERASAKLVPLLSGV